ncbi:class I SAM-dependent methyltransferase [Waterburya agarophytonicola K14]|uniref:Class I SAM-dependent methyltransferase n=1 Tax=Waterburya agarophytonicola KI4 TaxID=2874699 RepID=A0A964FHR1_9CYAN|nr:class I SAM-dependent methyltransferase [Waterburya agarophytonicola]MCC0177718.1 class I SAM-dependent methyltransferase [Waterburya agarophytonicola KI4]
MTNSQAWHGDVSSLLNNIYRCADKSSWYGSVIDAYDRTRPRYPAILLDKMQNIAQLKPGKEVLEIGSGPGIATIELAKLGLNIVAVEPNLSACQLAKQKCIDYPQVKFVNSTFEEWGLEEQKFDAIIATTSFHWVTPEVRMKKTASALKDDGYLVLLWNTPPQPSYEVAQELTPIYQTHAPELAPQEDLQNHQKNIGKFGREIIDSGYYQDLVREQIICQVSYTVDEYLTLLTTLSSFIRLESSSRNTLLAELKQVLGSSYGDRLELFYLSMFQIASKSLY